jgi:hypothetical protein
VNGFLVAKNILTLRISDFRRHLADTKLIEQEAIKQRKRERLMVDRSVPTGEAQ